MILYGPPGSGKTTLARIIAAASGAAFEELSAIEAGLPEVRAVLERARHRGGGTVFFLDEIHRFSRPQQDALLRAVEEGVVVLIGATTESPRHQVSGALLSRLRVYEVDALDAGDLRVLIERAQARGELGEVQVDPDAVELLARRAAGDARVALGALELAASGRQRVDIEAASSALETALVRYDATADRHYETISAWIKATRGSDPDASLYYLATMLEGGEDPRFIARRMVIFASEDVGNADPAALTLAAAAAQAVELVGLPECTYALAQAAIYLSLAPKSNAAGSALAAAREDIRQRGAARPPEPLRPNGSGYDYPHSRPGQISPQELLPPGLEGTRFYKPGAAEAKLEQALAEIRAARGR
jgi:putative ATPase